MTTASFQSEAPQLGPQSGGPGEERAFYRDLVWRLERPDEDHYKDSVRLNRYFSHGTWKARAEPGHRGSVNAFLKVVVAEGAEGLSIGAIQERKMATLRGRMSLANYYRPEDYAAYLAKGAEKSHLEFISDECQNLPEEDQAYLRGKLGPGCTLPELRTAAKKLRQLQRQSRLMSDPRWREGEANQAAGREQKAAARASEEAGWRPIPETEPPGLRGCQDRCPHQQAVEQLQVRLAAQEAELARVREQLAAVQAERDRLAAQVGPAAGPAGGAGAGEFSTVENSQGLDAPAAGDPQGGQDRRHQAREQGPDPAQGGPAHETGAEAGAAGQHAGAEGEGTRGDDTDHDGEGEIEWVAGWDQPIADAIRAALSEAEQTEVAEVFFDVFRGKPVPDLFERADGLWDRCHLEQAGVSGDDFDDWVDGVCSEDPVTRGLFALEFLKKLRPPEFGWLIHRLAVCEVAPELERAAAAAAEEVPLIDVPLEGEGEEAELARELDIVMKAAEEMMEEGPNAAYHIQRMLFNEVYDAWAWTIEVLGPPPELRPVVRPGTVLLPR